MNSETAIEILTDYDNHSQYYADPDFKTALKLGIEALKEKLVHQKVELND